MVRPQQAPGKGCPKSRPKTSITSSSVVESTLKSRIESAQEPRQQYQCKCVANANTVKNKPTEDFTYVNGLAQCHNQRANQITSIYIYVMFPNNFVRSFCLYCLHMILFVIIGFRGLICYDSRNALILSSCYQWVFPPHYISPFSMKKVLVLLNRNFFLTLWLCLSFENDFMMTLDILLVYFSMFDFSHIIQPIYIENNIIFHYIYYSTLC